MAFMLIAAYAARWRPNTNDGLLFIQYMSGTRKLVKTIRVETPEEMMTIVDILRNEKPVYFDPTNNVIATNYEIVGEEET